MAKYTTADIRNIALVGHGDSGKTTLVEAMLFAAKAVNRLGSVDDGSSHSDWDDQEKERQSSIYTSILHCDWKGRTINILDAPGYPDFVGQALSSLRAAEAAAVVIAAPSGIGVNTRRMWDAAGLEGLARFIVVTRMDGDNVDYDAVMASDKDRFNRFFHAMLDAGVYFAPSAFEAGFVSAAHSAADIAATLAHAEMAFAAIR